MSKLEQAVRQLLDYWDLGDSGEAADRYMAALREALAEQAEQEPVCKNGCDGVHGRCSECQKPVKQVPVGKVLLHEGDVTAKGFLYCPLPEGTDLYAAPAKPVDLTDDEILQCGGMDGADDWAFNFARAVIAAYKEKNRG